MSSIALRAWFEAYVDAFNRNDFDGFGAYYAPDVIFQGQAAQVVGRDAVLAFYRTVKARLDETLDLLTFVGAPAGDRIVVEMRTRLHAREDWPEMPTGPMRRGDRRESVSFIIYDVAHERFTRVRSARFTQPAVRA
ncbi:YybH family protein [Sphingomonas sp. MMS24-J13]|uniref:YybH family protein n=1 Tax=Sphingomonas sp. MMS24-J13 TaxID=3238686 RepID=UPI00384EC433